GVDTGCVRTGMPVIYSSVILHSRITANVSGLGNHPQEVASSISIHHLPAGYSTGVPFFVLNDRLHKIVGDSNAIIGVLKENRTVGRTIERTVITRCNQRPGFFLFLFLASDEVHYIRMIDIQNHHLGGSPSFPTRFDDPCKGVIALHKGNRTGGLSATGE